MPAPVDQAFKDLIRHASSESWCTRWGCSTCAAHDFRKALAALDGGAVAALSSADLGALTRTASWRDCVLLALWDVGSEGRSRVLQAWLPRVRTHIRLADVVLFYVVRRMPLDRETASEWVQACEEIAVDARDVSLIESLVYTLGAGVAEHPGLLALSQQIAGEHGAVQKALRVAGHDPFGRPGAYQQPTRKR